MTWKQASVRDTSLLCREGARCASTTYVTTLKTQAYTITVHDLHTHHTCVCNDNLISGLILTKPDPLLRAVQGVTTREVG